LVRLGRVVHHQEGRVEMILNPNSSKPDSPALKAEDKTKHLHEYVRSNANKKIYRCMDPDCTHYQSRDYLEGKRARCHKCKEEMILTKLQLRNRVPVCLDCTRSHKGKRVKVVRGFLERILEK